MTTQSMYQPVSSAFSASRNGREPLILGEGSNPMQSLDMGSKRTSGAGRQQQVVYVASGVHIEYSSYCQGLP